MYLIFNISIHNFEISALFVLIYYFLIEIYKTFNISYNFKILACFELLLFHRNLEFVLIYYFLIEIYKILFNITQFLVEIHRIITTICIISYKITITCLICDGNSHTLNFQTILHVVTVQVISSICLKMYLIFNISIHNFKISALFV